MGDEHESNVEKFIKTQNEMNEITSNFIEIQKEKSKEQKEKQEALDEKLSKLLEIMSPPLKRKKRDDTQTCSKNTTVDGNEAILGSGKNKVARKEAILGSKKATEEVTVSSDEENKDPRQVEDELSFLQGEERTLGEKDDTEFNERALWETLQNNTNEPDGSAAADEKDRDLDSLDDEELEALLGSKYQDLLDQTEEKVGQPISKKPLRCL